MAMRNVVTSTAVCVIAGLTTIAAMNCVQYSLPMTYNGRYCTGDGTLTYPQLPHQCRYLCLQSATCTAYNYNATEKTCTHFTSPCPEAFIDSAMEFAVFAEIPVNQCYEWVRYLGDPFDPRNIRTHPELAICRMQRGGNNILCYAHSHFSRCYGPWGTTEFGHIEGYPCQLLSIAEACTIFWVPYVARDLVPPRAVKAGHMADGRVVYVTKIDVLIPGGAGARIIIPGHYVVGAENSCGPMSSRVLCESTMMMMVVL